MAKTEYPIDVAQNLELGTNHDCDPPFNDLESREEFGLLSALVDELSVFHGSLFPFWKLNDNATRQLFGFPVTSHPQYRNVAFRAAQASWMRGNYIASSISHELRIEGRKSNYRFHNLSCLLDLPTEMILEVFGFLHPFDLYNVIRSSKIFRNLLLNRNTYSVWNSTFQLHPSIPSCPPEMSFPRWATLLFGYPSCDECGMQGAMVNFTCRKRLCGGCSGKLFPYIHGHMFKELEPYPDQFEVIQSLVSYTTQHDSMIYDVENTGYKDKRFLYPETRKMVIQMQRFLQAIDDGIPYAREKYEIFKKATASTTRKYMEHVRMCNNWGASIYSTIQARVEESRLYILEAFKKFLMTMRFNPRDVRKATEYNTYWLVPPNNINKRSMKRTFYQWLLRMEAPLKQALSQRLAVEHKERVKSRRAEMRKFYLEYVRKLDPATWQYLPDADRITYIDLFAQHINDRNPSAELPKEAAEARIQVFLDQWIPQGKKRLLEVVSNLDLATSVFVCPSHVDIFTNESFALIGWDDVAVHLDCNTPSEVRHCSPMSGYKQPDFRHNIEGSLVAAHLVGLLGLNPGTALAKDLEAIDARFICTECKEKERGHAGHYVMTFKESVSHEINDVGHGVTSFVLLTDEARESVILHERAFTRAGDPSWSCRHCSAHFESQVKRKMAIEHVKKAHSILRPLEKIDFIYHQQKESSTCRKQYFVSSDSPQIYRCNRCLGPSKIRLRTWESVRRHLHDKHGLCEAQVVDNDWYKIEFYTEVLAGWILNPDRE